MKWERKKRVILRDREERTQSRNYTAVRPRWLLKSDWKTEEKHWWEGKENLTFLRLLHQNKYLS